MENFPIGWTGESVVNHAMVEFKRRDEVVPTPPLNTEGETVREHFQERLPVIPPLVQVCEVNIG